MKQINTQNHRSYVVDSFFIEIMGKGWFVAIKMYSIQFFPFLNKQNGIEAAL